MPNTATLDRTKINLGPAITPVTVAAGDGIGPEITAAVLRILAAAGAPIEPQEVTMGAASYQEGVTSGIPQAAWDSIEQTGIILKGPISTPRGNGWKSLNVTLRKSLGLFANVRPVSNWAPILASPSQPIDVIVIRENEEDLYAGIEHRQTEQVTQCLKLITKAGCERICRYAFAYAEAHDRQKVTCMVKDNIMKLTDGLFHDVFQSVAIDYPNIAAESQIIDIGAARLATRPEEYDVVLAPNLYGDILSDIIAEVAGSVGLAPSTNIGLDTAMFEAIHGSAPDIAGKDLANPSGMLLAAVQMLVHLGHGDIAATIHNAWLRTLEEKVRTIDVADRQGLISPVGTKAFADAIIKRLGMLPRSREAILYSSEAIDIPEVDGLAEPQAAKILHGIDIFLESRQSPYALGRALKAISGDIVPLQMITNRGVQVYPKCLSQTSMSDHWRCRFMQVHGLESGPGDLINLQQALVAAGFNPIKTENLYHFDGVPGYSLGQGQ